MADSFVAKLFGSLQTYEYRKCIPYISPGSGIPCAQFATRDDHNRWQIETSLTFKGKYCKTLNPDLLFSIFGRYSGDEPHGVRALMIKWINDNRQAFDKVTFIGMIGKDVEFDTWLINMESPQTIGDEFALYALCKLFNRHAHVLTMGNTWHTISVEGTYGEKYVEDVCDIHLLFLARDTIAELKRKTVGVSVPPDEIPTVQPIVKLSRITILLLYSYCQRRVLGSRSLLVVCFYFYQISERCPMERRAPAQSSSRDQCT